MSRKAAAMLIIFSLAAPVRGEEPYDATTSPPTQAPAKELSEHKPRKAPARQLKQMEQEFKRAIKKTSPNPKVQKPSGSPMPANAPEMPKAPQVPEPPPAATAAEKFFSAVAKVMTKSWGPNIFVWLPAISTDPNAGPTYGVLPVMVLADSESRHIRHLLAPSYTYNALFGQTGTVRYYWYPTDTSQLFTVGSFSQRTNRELKLRYENPSLLDGVLFFRGEGFYNVNGSKRFFGLGPDTLESGETGYTAEDALGRVQVGVNFYRSWRASFGHRFERLTTDENIIPNIPDLHTNFSDVPGVGTNNTSASEFRLLWDTRDSPVTPSDGKSGELFVEKTSHALGSDSDYIRYGLEGKRFFPWKNPKHRTIVHTLYEWANGPFIPFYELPSIGGRDTLRGFGDGRLVDRGRLVF